MPHRTTEMNLVGLINLNLGSQWRAGGDRCSRRQPNLTGFTHWARRLVLSLALIILSQMEHGLALANDDANAAERPVMKPDRSKEDWSPFADAELRTQSLDRLKYIPLFPSNPDSYISLGFNLREIFETSYAPAFGTVATNPGDAYGLQRAQFHIDVHLNENWQLFTQFEDVRAIDKTAVGPNDANRFDLRLAFMIPKGLIPRRH